MKEQEHIMKYLCEAINMVNRKFDTDLFNLWDHQRTAINVIKSYIDDYTEGITQKSALVQMPTGSGKSGVIAIVSRFLESNGITLVLTPRVSLRDQLTRDINGRFFKNINYPIKTLPKHIECVHEGSNLSLSDNTTNKVITMTIQMLMSLSDNNKDSFEILRNSTSLLIVDEGHYEPAKEWSKIIREIKSPKIIFTATPYRNDFKSFDIDNEYCHFISFAEAQRKDYLRQVQVISRPSSARKSEEVFVKDIIDFYVQTFPSVTTHIPRIIIRCDDCASIRRLAIAFAKTGKTVIGIHETFTDFNEIWERKHVPNPDEENATVWIHQFKLLEGIDDSRFQVLAIYEKINNARSLVQQIGRILRNPKRLKNQVGYVLEYWDNHHKTMWDGFLKYDTYLETSENGLDEGILEDLLKSQPKISYIDGRFRTQFDFESIQPEDDIQLPLKTILLVKLDTFKMNEFVDDIIEYFKEKDRIVHLCDYTNNNIRVILSVSYKNSKFLVNHPFIEAAFQVTVICEFDDYISFYDSSGLNVTGRVELGVGGSLGVDKMKKLFSFGKGARLTSVSLNNTNLGTSSIRSKSITAASIDSTIPSFDDYSQVCTTAEGYSCEDSWDRQSKSIIRRYVGFSRGRVSEKNVISATFAEYMHWLKHIQKIIEGNSKEINALKRYALERNVPSSPSPKNILFDVQEIEEAYATIDGRDESFNIKDACIDVVKGKFSFEANGRKIESEIKFDGSKYIINSPALDSQYSPRSDDYPSSIVKYINRNQIFRILPDDLESIYVRGQFYSPMMKIGKNFDVASYELGNCFHVDNIIGTCKLEKGRSKFYVNNNDDWDPDSLFGIISRLGAKTTVKSHFGNPNLIICDDVGTEVADFILCDTTEQKIIFIHAKATSRFLNCSASSLHDVCSQAVKNLGYLAMYNNFQPSKLDSW